MLDRRSPLRRGSRPHVVLRSLGPCMVTAGVLLLLLLGYEIVGTGMVNEQKQAELDEQLRTGWTDPTVHQPVGGEAPSDAELPIGTPIAVLHIPRLGADYERVVVEGTEAPQLAQGPGHYVGTARPGELGNVALAGHRVGQGSPFLDLDLVRPGDPIVLETADTWFVYRVLGDPVGGDFDADPSGIPGRRIVAPTDTHTISPVPNGAPDDPPQASYLTLTTCHPKFSARQRLVIHALLDGTGIDKMQFPDVRSVLRDG